MAFYKTRIERQAAAFETDRPQAAGKQPQAVGIVIGGMVRHENELSRRQRARIRAKRSVLPHEHRIVPAVEPEPVIGLRHNVHDMPPVPVEAPYKFQRRKTVKGGIQHARNNGPQIAALQVLHETPVQFLRFRCGRFALRRARPEGKMRAVQHAVLAGKHGGCHLIVRRKLPQHFRIVPALAQHRIRIRQG